MREGDLRDAATIITTIDQGDGLEAYINVPLEQATELRAGLTVELLDAEGKVVASEPGHLRRAARRRRDAVGAGQGHAAAAPPALRVMQYVRARLIWSNDPALVVPIVAVNRSPASTSCSWRKTGEQGRGASEAGHLGVVVDNYVVRAG